MNESYSVWPLCLASLTGHHVFKVHPDCSLCQCFVPFYGCFIDPCMDRPNHILFMYSSVEGHLDCFYLLTIVNDAAVNTCVQVFV